MAGPGPAQYKKNIYWTGIFPTPFWAGIDLTPVLGWCRPSPFLVELEPVSF
jgi:hypothetical protein